MNWYLLQTKPNAHVMACKNLRQQGFDIFLPFVTKTAKKNGKFLDIKTPLFPGYLFMGTSSDSIPWKTVNGTRGISKVVTLDGVYRPISRSIIEDFNTDAMSIISLKVCMTLTRAIVPKLN